MNRDLANSSIIGSLIRCDLSQLRQASFSMGSILRPASWARRSASLNDQNSTSLIRAIAAFSIIRRLIVAARAANVTRKSTGDDMAEEHARDAETGTNAQPALIWSS